MCNYYDNDQEETFQTFRFNDIASASNQNIFSPLPSVFFQDQELNIQYHYNKLLNENEQLDAALKNKKDEKAKAEAQIAKVKKLKSEEKELRNQIERLNAYIDDEIRNF